MKYLWWECRLRSLTAPSDENDHCAICLENTCSLECLSSHAGYFLFSFLSFFEPELYMVFDVFLILCNSSTLIILGIVLPWIIFQIQAVEISSTFEDWTLYILFRLRAWTLCEVCTLSLLNQQYHIPSSRTTGFSLVPSLQKWYSLLC